MEQDRKRTYILFAIVTLACALGSLTQTAMNSMLGGVQAEFGTDENVSQWLTSAYMLVIGIVVPLVAHLSKRFTVRALTLASLCISLCGGVVCLISFDFAVLLIGRILQAIGTGITLPILQTIAMTRFPPGQNATAMGIAGIALGFAPNIGPLIGGLLIQSAGWRSFFWMYLVAIALLILATLVFIRARDHEIEDAHLDITSFILSMIGFGALLIGLTNAASITIENPIVWIPILIGIIGLVSFIMRQRRIAHPLISMRIFLTRSYVVSFIMQDLLFASFMGITLILPLFVINVCQMSAVDAGAVFIPTTILAIVINPLSGWLSDKIGSRPVIIVAAILLSIGAVSMVFMDSNTPLWVMMVFQAIRGIGVSSLIGPLNSWGMSELPFKLMADGSSFFTAVRQACASFGTALMMVAISFCGTVEIDGGSVASAFGYQLAFGLSGLLSLCVLFIGVFFIRTTKNPE